MTPIRTTYLTPWQPPPFQPSRSRGPIPRGTGPTEGGDPNRVGTVTVVVAPPGAVAPGTSVTLTAVRTGGSAPMTYQWYDPTDTPIPGATGNSYTFTATISGVYKVVVDSPGAVDAPVAATVAVVVTPPAGAPWTPADIATSVWLDFSDASSVVLAPGGKISEVKDKSGNGHHFSQTVEKWQPGYLTSGQNGLGTSSNNSNPSGTERLELPGDTNARYVLFAHKWTKNDAEFTPIAFAIGSSLWHGGTLAKLFEPIFAELNQASVAYVNGQPPILAKPNVEPILRRSLAFQCLFLDGIDANGLRFARLAGGGYDRYFIGNYGEVIGIETSPLPQSDREKLEGYIAHKWGLAANLPANHPYKSAPPTK